MSNLEGGIWTAVSVSSYRISSVRLSSSLCGWKNGCIFLLSLFQKKGGQFYTMGVSVVVMAEEHRVSPV